MKRYGSRNLGHRIRATVAAVALLGSASGLAYSLSAGPVGAAGSTSEERIPNNHPDDLGRFKTPTIRALAARAPYFHHGLAATPEDVVRHYETHLGFVFTDEERADLVAFLNAL